MSAGSLVAVNSQTILQAGIRVVLCVSQVHEAEAITAEEKTCEAVDRRPVLPLCQEWTGSLARRGICLLNLVDEEATQTKTESIRAINCTICLNKSA